MKPVSFFAHINDRFNTAVAFHKENSDLFRYLGLPGFEALHEYQVFDELSTQRKVKQYYTDQYDSVLFDSPVGDINILYPLVKENNKMDVSMDDKINAIKLSWNAYQKWEEDTKRIYSSYAKLLLESGYVNDYDFLSEIVADVSQELVSLKSIILDMESTGFDLPHISDIQEGLMKKYRSIMN